MFFGGCFGEANLLIFVRPSVRPSVRPCAARPRDHAVQILIFGRAQNPPYLRGLFHANFERLAPLEGMVDFGRDQNANCRRYGGVTGRIIKLGVSRWRRHQGVTGQPRRAETTAKRSHTFANVNFWGSPRPQNLVNFVRPCVRPCSRVGAQQTCVNRISGAPEIVLPSVISGCASTPQLSIFVSVDLGALGDVIQDPSNSISVDLGDLEGVVL